MVLYLDELARQCEDSEKLLRTGIWYIVYVVPQAYSLGSVYTDRCPCIRTRCRYPFHSWTWWLISVGWCWDDWIFLGTWSRGKSFEHPLSFGMHQNSFSKRKTYAIACPSLSKRHRRLHFRFFWWFKNALRCGARFYRFSSLFFNNMIIYGDHLSSWSKGCSQGFLPHR